MKVIILAAGMGSRLGKYTENLPKAMLEFNGKPLIEWQLFQLKHAGFDDISIVTGYKSEKFIYEGVKYYHNKDYFKTNMIESLMCAKEELNDEVLVAYADIIYTNELLQKINLFNGDIGVACDEDWQHYWMQRYGNTETDLESLRVRGERIIEIGKPVHNSKEIDYRYIGLIKFSASGMDKALALYNKKKRNLESWKQSGNTFYQGYMTDLLNELIISNTIVEPIISKGGWLEFDTEEDYEITKSLLEVRKIDNVFFNLD